MPKSVYICEQCNSPHSTWAEASRCEERGAIEPYFKAGEIAYANLGREWKISCVVQSVVLDHKAVTYVVRSCEGLHAVEEGQLFRQHSVNEVEV